MRRTLDCNRRAETRRQSFALFNLIENMNLQQFIFFALCICAYPIMMEEVLSVLILGLKYTLGSR